MQSPSSASSVSSLASGAHARVTTFHSGVQVAPPLPGPLALGPRYSLHGLLGWGGRGLVYEALDRERGERVALKTSWAMDAQSSDQLRREFTMLTSVASGGVVKAHDFFFVGDRPCLSMELVRGVHFDAWVRDAELGMNEERLRAAFVALARGVQALHAAGTVHCDLKPSNVLVTSTGRVVILDLGIACPRGHVIAPEERLSGTPAYIAPEALQRVATSASNDCYSLGVMLYESLVGRLPFEGRPHEIVFAKQWLNPPRPRSVDPSLPEDLDRLCMRLLWRDPVSRAPLSEILALSAREARRHAESRCAESAL